MLTGDVSEHILPIAHGRGANGKSVFLRILGWLLGDYAMPADVSLFLARREGGATPELARLKGARLVFASELPDGGRLNENLVKSLTGGDRIAARHLYGEIFHFSPTAKFWISTNHKPDVRGTDNGIWRRIKLLPFARSFEGADRDLHLDEKLRDELPGILNWAVAGCFRWRADRLRDPKSVLVAVEEYRTQSDVLGTFIADRCVAHEACNTVRSSALVAAYVEWCNQNNERPLTARRLFQSIGERPGVVSRRSNGERVFQGLGLRADDERA